jgi:hypothetical protein
MKSARIVFGAIIAASVVYLTYTGEKTAPELLTSSANGFNIELATVPIAPEDTLILIPITITGPKTDNIKYLFRYAKPDLQNLSQFHRYGTNPITPVDSASGKYQASFRTSVKGSISYYYFEIRDPIGRYLNGIKKSDDQPLTSLAVGRVDSWIYYGRYLLIFLSITVLIYASLDSLKLLQKVKSNEFNNAHYLLSAVFLAILIVLTAIFRIQLTGQTWQGAPFGSSLGDNLVQIILVYVIFVYLVSRNISAKLGLKLPLSPRVALGYMGIGAFFLTLTAFLIPLVNVREFPAITVIFYAFLAFLAVVYLLMYRHTKNA